MSYSTSCGNGASSSYCVCSDYYGYSINQYKYYNENTGVYNCCNILSNYLSYTDTNSPTKILDYIKNSQSGNCGNFFSDKYPDITTDAKLKSDLPMIYWQGLMNASLFQNTRFTNVPITNGEEVTCGGGDIPVFLSYNDYESKLKQNKLLCTDSSLNSFKDIDFLGTSTPVPYSVFYVKDSSGNNCKSNTCTMKYDTTFNEYNMGDSIYTSSGNLYKNKSPNFIGWILFGIAIFIICLFIYYYFSKKERFDIIKYHLNSIKKNLGEKLSRQSDVIRDSFHVL